MKKTYKIEVDCANCANKMEDAARGTAGVKEVTVNFMTQKMTLTADDARFDEIVQECARTGKRIEKDFSIEL